MSLRDYLSALFGDDRFTTCEFMDSANTEVLADAVLALLEGPWFDEAVERMLDKEWEQTLTRINREDCPDWWRERWKKRRRPEMANLLRAALGEDTPRPDDDLDTYIGAPGHVDSGEA